jgi:hypothetical protein
MEPKRLGLLRDLVPGVAHTEKKPYLRNAAVPRDIRLIDAQRPDSLAGHVRLELRNVVSNYPFERSHRFPGFQPDSGHREYSRLGCGVEETQLGRSARISVTSAAGRS